MFRLRLHGFLYGLYGPRRPLSPERLLNLITHSLPEIRAICFEIIYSQYSPCCMQLN